MDQFPAVEKPALPGNTAFIFAAIGMWYPGAGLTRALFGTIHISHTPFLDQNSFGKVDTRCDKFPARSPDTSHEAVDRPGLSGVGRA